MPNSPANNPDELIILELFEILICNELIKKVLIQSMRKYIDLFNETGKFNYRRPIATPDFADCAQNSYDYAGNTLTQFLFNCELFIIKLYRLSEREKTKLKDTRLKKLRQLFVHLKSSDILSGQNRIVIFAGLFFDLNTLIVTTLNVDLTKSEDFEYLYRGYGDALIEAYGDKYVEKVKSLRFARGLNDDFIKELFAEEEVKKA